MMWQDLVFMAGSCLSLLFLLPTLRDSMANVPLGTALPSAALGFVYAATFLSLGMTFSGIGSICTAVMWSAIATFRSPTPHALLGDENNSPSPTVSPPNAD